MAIAPDLVGLCQTQYQALLMLSAAAEVGHRSALLFVAPGVRLHERIATYAHAVASNIDLRLETQPIETVPAAAGPGARLGTIRRMCRLVSDRLQRIERPVSLWSGNVQTTTSAVIEATLSRRGLLADQTIVEDGIGIYRADYFGFLEEQRPAERARRWGRTALYGCGFRSPGVGRPEKCDSLFASFPEAISSSGVPLTTVRPMCWSDGSLTQIASAATLESDRKYLDGLTHLVLPVLGGDPGPLALSLQAIPGAVVAAKLHPRDTANRVSEGLQLLPSDISGETVVASTSSLRCVIAGATTALVTSATLRPDVMTIGVPGSEGQLGGLADHLRAVGVLFPRCFSELIRYTEVDGVAD